MNIVAQPTNNSLVREEDQRFTANDMASARMGNDGSEDEQHAAAFTQKMQPIVQGLESKLREAINARGPIELRWLRNLEQFNSRYDVNTWNRLNQNPDRSKIFVNVTRPKTTAWEARLNDLLFPTDDKNWGINPTPVPDLVEAAEHAVQEAIAADEMAAKAAGEAEAMAMEGAPPEAIEAKQSVATAASEFADKARKFDLEVRQREEEAKKRSSRMEMEISDQLVECRYSSKARDVITDACRLGPGVMKGPVTSTKARRQWSKGPDGQYVMDMAERDTQEYRRVNPWDFYPDPEASEIADCGFMFERHAVNRQKLTKMAKRLGFHMPSVRSILREGRANNSVSELDHITKLRAIESADYGAVGNISSLFVVWEYHGYLETKEVVELLQAFERHDEANEFERIDDPTADVRVVVYFCNGRLLKIAADYPMDSGEWLYSVFSFEKSESMVLGGIGIPEMMSNEQAMLNAGVRMVLDNAGFAVSPQRVVDKTRVEPTNGSWQMTPGKTWWKTKEGANPNDRAFELHDIPMNVNLLQLVVDMALKFIDMTISMPTIAQGEQGQATGTFGGMSMLFNSANVVFRRIVKNFDDDMTTPNIRRAFDWNMQFNPKEEIKGDMQIEARGTSVLLVREVQAQQFMVIATTWSQHPVIAPAIKVYEILRLTLQTMSINPNDVLVSPEDFEKKLQAMAEAPQTDPDQLRAEAAIQTAQIRAQSSQLDAETRLQIAERQHEIAIMELMMKENLSFAQIAAGMEKVKMDNDSKERSLAVEVGLEQRNAEHALQMGRVPTGSGGAISLGSEPLSAGVHQ